MSAADKPVPLDYHTKNPQALARHMGLFSLVVYGVGDMIGSGIYATVGVAAGAMGNAVWAAFVAAMIAAMLTGLSYASLASRYPRAGGASFVTQHAYRKPFLSYLVGLTVAASGLTSMATAANAFSSAFKSFLPEWLPLWLIIVVFLTCLAAVNFWGIKESMWVNLGCTLIEVGGLIFIVAVGARYWGSVDYTQTASQTSIFSGMGSLLVLNGAVLTFYSFVGFEDMMNVAEECKNPRKTLPYGMIIALGVVTLLYIGVGVTAVSVVDYRQLADAPRHGPPLVQITNKAAPWLSPGVFTFITMFAVANTALINYIMGSRLLYGMARQQLVPAPLGKVHHARRTPYVAIAALFFIVLTLSLVGAVSKEAGAGIKYLASATALLLLACFTVVNIALIVLKRRPGEPQGGFEVPLFVPALGALVCTGLITARLSSRNAAGVYEWQAPVIALALVAGIASLYFVMRPKNITEESLAAAEAE